MKRTILLAGVFTLLLSTSLYAQKKESTPTQKLQTSTIRSVNNQSEANVKIQPVQAKRKKAQARNLRSTSLKSKRVTKAIQKKEQEKAISKEGGKK